MMKIGILSRGSNTYSTRRLARKARAMGHQVTVMDPFDCTLHIGGRGTGIYHRGRSVATMDVIIPRFSQKTVEYGIEVLQHFEYSGATVLNRSDAILRARHKFHALRCLAQNNIPVPPSLITGSSQHLEKDLRKIGEYPFIMKPFQGTQGRGILLVDTPTSMRSVVETLCETLHENYVIQQFISEAAGVDLRALIIGGKLIGAIQRIGSPGEFRANLHRGATGRLIQLEPSEAQMAITAAKVMDLCIAGVDMLRSQKGSLVIEVNPSPGFEGFEQATGFDVAEEIIRLAGRANRRLEKLTVR